MKSIRCNECGLLNWDTQQNCKRCQTPLFAAPAEIQPMIEPEIPLPAESRATPAPLPLTAVDYLPMAAMDQHLRSHRRPAFILAAFLLFLVVAGAAVLIAFALPTSTWISLGSKPDYADLIPNSSDYKKTWNILVNRENGIYISTQEQMSGLNIQHKPKLLPETLMLYHAGFLKFHEITSPPNESTDVAFLMNEFTIEPTTNQIATQWRLLNHRMKIADSPVNESNQWWVVPIGEREYGQVTEAEKRYDFATSTNFMDVTFKWKWKPNDFGRALDVADPSYKPPEDIVGRGNWLPADSLGMPVRDSRATYEGFAKLRRKDDGHWIVDKIWFADSPNQHYPSDEQNQYSRYHYSHIEGF